MEADQSSLEFEIEQYLSETNNELKHLAKLHKWLNKNIIDNKYDNLIVLAAPLVIPFILPAIILFTPLMVKSLKVLNRKAWLIGLFVMVSTPLLFVFLTDVFEVKVISIALSILAYFLFCFILKVEVDEWYKNMRVKIQREHQKKSKEQEEPNDWIIMR